MDAPSAPGLAADTILLLKPCLADLTLLAVFLQLPACTQGRVCRLLLEAACIKANAIVLIGFYEFPPEFLRNTSTLGDFIPANFRRQSQTMYQMNLHREAYS